MPVVVKAARTSEELAKLFAFRFNVAQKAAQTIPYFSESGMISDQCDSYPNTLNILARDQTQSLGSVRGLRYEITESSLNREFNFASAAQSLHGPFGFADMLVLAPMNLKQSTLLDALFKTLFASLVNAGLGSVFFLSPQSLWESVESIGFRKLGDAFNSKIYDEVLIPCVADLGVFYDAVQNMVKDREIMRFQESFYRVVFSPGEFVVVEGEKGSTGYIIDEGEVEVVKSAGEGIVRLTSLGRGNLIGEVGLLANEARTASMIAKTDLSCIAFDRTEFLKVMYQDPSRALDLFQIMSKRLSATNNMLSELRSKIVN